jgi:hypothetical protein
LPVEDGAACKPNEHALAEPSDAADDGGLARLVWLPSGHGELPVLVWPR